MNRRNYLVSAGGALLAVTGGAAAANATRADVLADGELARGKGEPVVIRRRITRDSVAYLSSSNEVEENGQVAPFERWARRECAEIGANEVVPTVDRRLDTAVEGVGSGVRHLLFGPVVTLDHTVTRDRDGSVVSEPNVPLDRLVSVAPRTVTVRVTLDGRAYVAELPTGVGHTEVSAD